MWVSIKMSDYGEYTTWKNNPIFIKKSIGFLRSEYIVFFRVNPKNSMTPSINGAPSYTTKDILYLYSNDSNTNFLVFNSIGDLIHDNIMLTSNFKNNLKTHLLKFLQGEQEQKKS